MTDQAKIDVTVEMTQDDIDQGVKYHAINCPWNRALFRALSAIKPNGAIFSVETSIRTSDAWVKGVNDYRGGSIDLPYDVVAWIDRYDSRDSTSSLTMAPITAVVSVPASLFEPFDHDPDTVVSVADGEESAP